MHLATAILLTAITFTPAVALGGDESIRLTAAAEKCGEQSNYSVLEACFSKVYRKSDQRLNQEYKELIHYLNVLEDKKHKQRLINSQKLWIKFRESDCAFYSDGEPIRLNTCLSERTIQRLKELEKFNTSYAMGCNGCPW